MAKCQERAVGKWTVQWGGATQGRRAEQLKRTQPATEPGKITGTVVAEWLGVQMGVVAERWVSSCSGGGALGLGQLQGQQ